MLIKRCLIFFACLLFIPLFLFSCNGEEKCQPVIEQCNGKDDDCNGIIDDLPEQNCSNPCGTGTSRCVNGVMTPCSAPQPSSEVCDGRDNDCDGATDEDVKQRFYRDSDGDGYGTPSSFQDACSTPSGFSNNSDDCNDADGNIHPGATEQCDGKDNNCNGTTDEGCACTTGTTQPCGEWGELGECELGTQSCVNGSWGECTGGKKPTEEACNGLDDDCDGQIDDGLSQDDYESNDTCEAATVLQTVPESTPEDPLIELANASIYLTNGSGDEDWFQIPTDEGSGVCVPFTSECCYYFTIEFYLPEGSNRQDLQICLNTDGDCSSFSNSFCSTSEDWDSEKNAYVITVCWSGTCGFEDGKTFYINVKGATPDKFNCKPYTLKYLFFRSDQQCE